MTGQIREVAADRRNEVTDLWMTTAEAVASCGGNGKERLLHDETLVMTSDETRDSCRWG